MTPTSTLAYLMHQYAGLRQTAQALLEAHATYKAAQAAGIAAGTWLQGEYEVPTAALLRAREAHMDQQRRWRDAALEFCLTTFTEDTPEEGEPSCVVSP